MTEQTCFRFFLPNARVLDKDEIENLPVAKLKAVAAVGAPGVWLEIDGLDKSWIDKQGNITIPGIGTKTGEKGSFLNIFCPDGTCEVLQGTDLP